jgi:hypothetical protein
MERTKPLDPTRSAARTNSADGANELGGRCERTRPTARTNSADGANELDRRQMRIESNGTLQSLRKLVARADEPEPFE